MAVFRPTSIAEAVSELSAHPALCIVAGGTDVMVAVQSGAITLTDVMSLRSIRELHDLYHDRDRDCVRIGAATPFAQLTTGPIEELVPALGQAARALGSVQIRNAATIGGSLGTAAANGDALVVFSALEATVELASSGGLRTVAASAFAAEPPETRIQADELITAVEIPVGAGSQHFAKVAPRGAMAAAVLNAAVVLDRDDAAVRIAVGGVAPAVVRIASAETWCSTAIEWDDPRPDTETERAFGHRVSEALVPRDDERATGAYRRHAAGVLATRLLRRCLA